ncbi:acyl-ACP desaturase [Streptomyces sp. NPDC001073]
MTPDPSAVRLGRDTMMNLRFVPEPTIPRRRRNPAGWIRELEPVAERQFHEHLRLATEWYPHEYVPWSRGQNFGGPLHGVPWRPEQSDLSPAVRASLITSLLAEDNLPHYHRHAAGAFGLDGAWGSWIHRWTAEKSRHAAALREYLHVTRAVDPAELERTRMQQASRGDTMEQSCGLATLAYLAVQEVVTSISYRNTGAASGDTACEALLARIAADENLHTVFYRGLLEHTLTIWPDHTMRVLADTVRTFRMPAHAAPGFDRMSVSIAASGIYNLRIHHDDVLLPFLQSLGVPHRGGLASDGERACEELSTFLAGLDQAAVFQEEQLQALQPRFRRVPA